jgi:hypothetical protein
MDLERYNYLLSLFKVLADDTRLRILGMVAEKPCSVEELASRLKLKEPTVSHHLTRLGQANLLKMERDKNSHYYQLIPNVLQNLSKEILSLEAITAPEQDTQDQWELKIIKTFIINGKLSQIPASRKKREVVLAHLLQAFEHEREYPEKELNQILSQYHEDVATLRREFIAFGWMSRENQIYKRI